MWTKLSGMKPEGNKYRRSMEILPEDGDLGIDFSSMVEEKPVPMKIEKPTEEELPEVALEIDATPDYYSVVGFS